MSDLTLGFFGAGAGLLIALFGNVVFLPYALRQQSKKLPTDYRAPVLGWDKQKMASLTRFSYRFQMPILFGALGAFFAIQMFGGAE